MKGRHARIWLAACVATASAALRADVTALRENRARWEAAAIADYEYGYNKFCECHPDTPPETIVTVTGGAVSRVYHLHAGSDREVGAAPEDYPYYWTVDDLFDLLESAFRREADVRVDYDAALGYPTRLSVDYDHELIGDEVDVRVTRLVRR